MAISVKQKKRLKDSAVLLRNARVMAAEMEEINLEYATELRSIVDIIKTRSADNSLPKKTKILDKKTRKPFRSKRTRKKLPTIKGSQSSHEEQAGPRENAEETLNVSADMPNWAKDLWRKIMFNCHPDRLNLDEISASEIDFKEEILEAAMEANEKEDWPEMIALSAVIDQYTDKLSHKKQMGKLNSLYSDQVSIISKIQESISWVWGANWDSP